jgi:hypothetical protein
VSRITAFAKSNWWWLTLVAGWAVIVIAAFNKKHIAIDHRKGFTVDSGWVVFALFGVWLVCCLWAIAVVDLITRARQIRRGNPFVALPGNIKLPQWSLSWLMPAGFGIGLFLGHFFW